jgi:hypothetical protein
MANSGFVTIKGGSFSKPKVYEALCEIVQRRFKGRMRVDGDAKDDIWNVCMKDGVLRTSDVMDAYRHEFSVEFASKRKLEFRHPISEWGHWAQMSVEHELAAKFGGMISDEGVGGHWKPDPKKHATYEKWLDLRFSHIDAPWVRMFLRRVSKAQVPKGLRGL